MSDNHQDRLMRELAQDYNDPPATPRDEIWKRVAATRRRQQPRSAWRRLASPWVWMPAAAAVILLLGVMIGRDSLRQQAEQAVAVYRQELATENAKTLFKLAAGPTLGRAETLLTRYRSGAPAMDEQRLADWAGDLVAEIRLLLDSPAAEDPQLKRLLEDMELVFLRMRRAALGTGGASNEEVRQAIEDRDLLLRLRAEIPSGYAGYPGA
jgi:hypothetical protein